MRINPEDFDDYENTFSRRSTGSGGGKKSKRRDDSSATVLAIKKEFIENAETARCIEAKARTAQVVTNLTRKMSPEKKNQALETYVAWVNRSLKEAALEFNLEKDVATSTFRSGGAGGQNVNKVNSGVRVTHIISGIVAESTETRDQFRNKAAAFSKLTEKLTEHLSDWKTVLTAEGKEKDLISGKVIGLAITGSLKDFDVISEI